MLAGVGLLRAARIVSALLMLAACGEVGAGDDPVATSTETAAPSSTAPPTTAPLTSTTSSTTTEPPTTAPPAPTTTLPEGPPASVLSLVTTDFDFDPASAEAQTDVEITIKNRGLFVHNLLIEGVDGFMLQARPEANDTGRVVLSPGTYTIFCNIAGHREAGMEGQLVISD